MYTVIKEGFIPLYGEDAVRITKSNTICSNITIVDKINSNEAHRDAIQLIPESEEIHRWQYIGGLLSDCLISNCKIYSNGMLQGIFGVDGLFLNINIENNLIKTKSQHEITIAGLISGSIQNNIGSNNNEADISLYPLRIGGNIDEKNVWIMSFLNSGVLGLDEIKKIAYEKIDYKDNYPIGKKKSFKDLRFETFNSRDIFIENFDLKNFQSTVINKKIFLEKDIKDFCSLVKKVAIDNGDIIK